MLNRITIDPAICLGQPTIRRMRITVSLIVKQIACGMTTAAILEAYPELESEDIVQALRFGELLPRLEQMNFSRVARRGTI